MTDMKSIYDRCPFAKSIEENIIATLNEQMETNEEFKAMMREAQANAAKKNMSQDEWNKFKRSMVAMLFYQLLAEHADIREKVADEMLPILLEEINATA